MEIHLGNILDIQQGVIVHGVNAQGAYAAGIALQIKDRFPEAKLAYENHLRQFNSYNEMLGTISHFKVNEEPSLVIVNAVTQKNYGRDKAIRYVSYDAIDDAFSRIKRTVIATKKEELFDIHFPLIGAGLGNGSWKVISAIIENVFADDERFKLHLWVLPGTVIPKD